MKAWRASLLASITLAAAVLAGDDQHAVWVPQKCDEVGLLPPPLQTAFHVNNPDVDINWIYAGATYTMDFIRSTPGAAWSWTTETSNPTCQFLVGSFAAATCSVTSSGNTMEATRKTEEAGGMSTVKAEAGAESSVQILAPSAPCNKAMSQSSWTSAEVIVTTTLVTTTQTTPRETLQTGQSIGASVSQHGVAALTAGIHRSSASNRLCSCG